MTGFRDVLFIPYFYLSEGIREQISRNWKIRYKSKGCCEKIPTFGMELCSLFGVNSSKTMAPKCYYKVFLFTKAKDVDNKSSPRKTILFHCKTIFLLRFTLDYVLAISASYKILRIDKNLELPHRRISL